MIRSLTSFLRRFRRQEDGVITVEFALMIPAYLFILFSAIEYGLTTTRHTMMERALDQTVRDIRLSTGFTPQHDEIKELICERARIIPQCEESLTLEMIKQDLRNWHNVSESFACVDRREEVAPVQAFTTGLDNQLMMLRVCASIDPIFHLVGFLGLIPTSEDGDLKIITKSAFVQEPR